MQKKEIIINGEKITFYSAREKGRKKDKLIEKSSFFSHKYRYIHITFLNILLIFVIAMLLAFFYGENKGTTKDGFNFFLIKRDSLFKQKIYFTFTIKNILKKENKLNLKKIQFQLYDENAMLIYNAICEIKKENFKRGEIYTESFIINKLSSGRYRSIIKVENKDFLVLDFVIKRKR